jgi:hypothetical protein
MSNIIVHATNGHEFETEVLSKRAHFTGHNQLKFLNFDEAIDWVVAHQPRKWNTRRPRTVLGLALFEAVRIALPPQHQTHLQLFVAVDSVLDSPHGVDGFFQCGSIWTIATFDLSIVPHPSKTPNHRIITKADFENHLDEVGSEIASELLEKIYRYEQLTAQNTT